MGLKVALMTRHHATLICEEARKLLLDAGAPVNVATTEGETPLMKAADEGNAATLQLLISAGADVNTVDDEGETALDKAQDEGNRSAARVLRAAGAR